MEAAIWQLLFIKGIHWAWGKGFQTVGVRSDSEEDVSIIHGKKKMVGMIANAIDSLKN